MNHWNVPVVERRLAIAEVQEAYQQGKLDEAFGTGTAAVISPVGELFFQEERMLLNNGETGELSQKLYNTLTGIQNGEISDPFNWVVEVKED